MKEKISRERGGRKGEDIKTLDIFLEREVEEMEKMSAERGRRKEEDITRER